MASQKETIIHILYSGLGGHASVVFSLIEADATRNYDHALIFYGIEELPVAYAGKCRKLQAAYFVVRKKPGFDKDSYKEVTDVIARVKPKAILLHSVNLILPVWLAARKNKSKLIAVEHQPNHLKSKREYLWSFLLMVLADKVVYLTALYQEQMKKILKMCYRDNKVSVINNGINTDVFKEEPGSTTDIGMLARITPTKDHKTLLKAWKLLESKLNCNLIIAGDGELRIEMERLSVELKLQNVTFAGMLDENDSALFLKKLKVYVHASLGETMSTSIMQAMASGKVIVASNVEGINNMIDDNKNGILVTAGNAEQLADAIESAFVDESLRKSLSYNARKTAEEKFSNQTMFQKYLTLIES